MMILRETLTEAVKVFDNPNTNDLDELIHLYLQALGDMLNTHAPLKTKQLRSTHTQPWFCNRIKSEIILRHKSEQKWGQYPTEYNYWAFYHQWRHVANIIKTAERGHYITIIRENKDSITP